jgi:hypothetical protein
VDGILLIGDYKLGVLSQPRALMSQQTPDGRQMLVPVELVGLPKEVTLPAGGCLMWEATDEGLINAYREHVTGLVLAKPPISLVKG